MGVVLDTNILIAASGSRNGASFALLRALRERRSIALAIEPLLLEDEAVLERAEHRQAGWRTEAMTGASTIGGMTRMANDALRLPGFLLAYVRQVAREERVSMNRFFLTAIAEQVSALKTEHDLRARLFVAITSMSMPGSPPVPTPRRRSYRDP